MAKSVGEMPVGPGWGLGGAVVSSSASGMKVHALSLNRAGAGLQ